MVILLRKTMKINDLQEKYERLLEQYMFECDRNEQLFDYLFHQENDATLELFVKADAADTLLAAATTSRKIIQQAEEQAKYIESSLMERLNSVLKQKNNIRENWWKRQGNMAAGRRISAGFQKRSCFRRNISPFNIQNFIF